MGTVTPRWVRFEVVPALGAKVSSMARLSEEIALRLGSAGVRVRRQGSTVRVEVPREDGEMVRLLPLAARLGEILDNALDKRQYSLRSSVLQGLAQSKLPEARALRVRTVDGGDNQTRLAALAAPGKLILTARQLPSPDSTGQALAVQPLSQEGFGALLNEQARRRRIGRIEAGTVEAIYRELMSGSFALEQPLRVGFLGPRVYRALYGKDFPEQVQTAENLGYWHFIMSYVRGFARRSKDVISFLFELITELSAEHPGSARD